MWMPMDINFSFYLKMKASGKYFMSNEYLLKLHK